VWVGRRQEREEGRVSVSGKKIEMAIRVAQRKFGRDFLARERNVEIKQVSREERAGFDSHRDSVGWD
jgi:hypothetical protein